MKKLFFVTLLVIGFVAGAHATHLFAADPSYTLLAPIPLNGANHGVTNSVSLSSTSPDYISKIYIPGLVQLIIGLAGALAVLRIVIGGFQYVTAASGMGKSDGKETIKNALIGLLLAISSWVILNTLNPNLLKFNFDLAPVDQNPGAVSVQTTSATGGSQTGTGSDTGSGSGSTDIPNTAGISPATGLTTVAWADDSDERGLLESPNITYNQDNCNYVGQQNCTSLAGISSTVIDDVNALEADCNCAIVITGGTEYWNHDGGTNDINTNISPHRPASDPSSSKIAGAGLVLDLRLNNTDISEFIRNNGTPVTGTNCTKGTERYKYNGVLYVNEVGVEQSTGPHWHVCFY